MPQSKHTKSLFDTALLCVKENISLVCNMSNEDSGLKYLRKWLSFNKFILVFCGGKLICFVNSASFLSKQILDLLIRENLLTPEIAKKFSIEFMTKLDFSKLNKCQFSKMENYLKIVSARCPVSNR